MPRSTAPPRCAMVFRLVTDPTLPQIPGAPRRMLWTRVIPAKVSAKWVNTLEARVMGEVVPQTGSVGTTTGRPLLAIWQVISP